MVVKVLLVMSVFVFSIVSYADECSVWEGRVIKPVSPAAVALDVTKVPVNKGEYETTAAYNSRQDNAVRKLKKQYIAEVVPDMDSVFYDADSKVMTVLGYVLKRTVNFSRFHNGSFDLSYREPFYIKGVSISKKTGSYIGVNGFGVKRKIEKYESMGVVFVEDFVESYSMPIDSFVIKNLSPAAAKILKKDFHVSVLLTPKKPYFDFMSQFYEATIDDPVELSSDYTVVFADMKCALFHDNKGKVFKSVPIVLPTSSKPVEKPIVEYVPEIKKSLEPFEQTMENGKCRKIKIVLTFKPLKKDVPFDDAYLPVVRNKAIEILAGYKENFLGEPVKQQIYVAAGEIVQNAQVVDVFIRGGFCDSQLRY